jgi:hypothetical protein
VDVFGIIGAVGDDMVAGKVLDQLSRAQHLALLARSGQQAHWIAERIAYQMDLGAQAAAGATQTLGIKAPFSRRAPAA